MDGLWNVLGKIDNVAVLVLVLALLGMGFLYYTERKENRSDQQKLMELHLKLIDALNNLRVAIAAMTGKQV